MALTLRLPSPRALVCAALIGCVLFGSSPYARADAQVAAPIVKTIDAVLTVNPDRTAELIETRRIAVLKDSAIRAAGQQVATYIDRMGRARSHRGLYAEGRRPPDRRACR